MASSSRYHLLPEQSGRPSTDADVEAAAAAATTTNLSFLDPTKPTIIRISNVHPTVLFRLVTFIFFFAAVIILGIQSQFQSGGVPAIVFLSIALFRHLIAFVSYAISRFFVVKLTWRRPALRLRYRSGSGGDIVRSLNGRRISMIVDAMILVPLAISLAIGVNRNAREWYPKPAEGWFVGFVGLPFYVLSMVDGGQPQSVLLSMDLTLGAGEDDDDDAPEIPEVSYRDVEDAQDVQPKVVRIEETREEEGESSLV